MGLCMLVQLPHITERLMARFAEGRRVCVIQVCGERRQASESNIADVAGGFDIVAFVVQHQAGYLAEFFATFPTFCLWVCVIHLPYCGYTPIFIAA